MVVPSVHQEHAGQKTSRPGHSRPMFCYEIPGIFLTVPPSYDAVAFHLGQCEKHQCHGKLATSS